MDTKCNCGDPACKSEIKTMVEQSDGKVFIHIKEAADGCSTSTATIYLDRKSVEELIADLQRKLKVIE